MTGESTITTETRGHVFHIGLNRAAKRNSFTMEMLHSFARAYGEYDRDPALRCALVFAHGDHFTTGLDLADVGPRVASGESLVCEGGLDPWRVLDSGTSKPVVVAVQGWCLTAGLELLLASDIRLAAHGTKFGQIEVKRGIMPFGGATIRMPRLTGWGNAMRYLLTGDEFDAEEAYRIGLVQELVAPEALLERASGLAETVARQAPLAVQESLRSARLSAEKGQGAALTIMEEQVHRLMASEDAMEGMLSFMERRDAVFKGR